MQLAVGRWKQIGAASAAAILIALYTYGAVQQAQRVNLDMLRVDQEAYMNYARNLYETEYRYVGGRNRMPVYAFIQSWLYDPDLTQTQYFTRGKYFNIGLSIVLLIGIFGIFTLFFPPLFNITLWLVTAFTVFVFRAGYFQTELLFYFLNFCCFLLLGKLLIQPSWKLAIPTGVLLGITHLTKASILPAIALFSLFFLIKTGSVFWQTRSATPTQLKQQIAKPLLALMLVIICFLGTISPYLLMSKRVFGSYFYNVNSTFYLWYDSWDEAEAGTGAHGDNRGYPELPPEEIPSLQKYLREHTTAQILDRVWDGIDELAKVAKNSYGYLKYMAIYGLLAIVSLAFKPLQSWQLFWRYRWLVLFALTYFVSYTLLYAWYAPIASGNRFTLAQFLPLMVSLTIVTVNRRSTAPQLSVLGRSINPLDALQAVVLGLILFELYPILTDRIVTMFAGT